ncbi:hypothetical protein Bca52824_052128 [Brassica carinata]|uniref:Uncharacterized protein n=1 Tax=Brassica carinata TaxID=52824 RepID=A0A8X7R6P1_BRACI|nr:hypothetical protein Bca52824_052128 [Brassica carinata]
MNRHKPNGTLRAKEKVSIRCIMCGDMRRVAKVVVVWVSCGRELSGCEVCVRAMCGRGLCGCATSSGQTSCEVEQRNTIENGLEFMDSWCDSPMVEDEELERLIRRSSLRSSES